MYRKHECGGGAVERVSKTLLAVALAALLGHVSVAQEPRSGRTEAPPVEPACPYTVAWTAWADDHGQLVESAAGGRVLVIRAADEELTKAQRKVIDSVIGVFDDTFGPPPAASDKPGVFFNFNERGHVDAALEELVRLNPHVSGWSQAMRSAPHDFVIEEPLAAGVAPFFAQGDEWSADNELAHRLGHLLLLQRFGHQPYWLTTGFAWYVEQETLGTIYCFPYREGFVSVGSHGGWKAELMTHYQPRKKTSASMTEIASLTRAKFDENGAACAWGAVRFLIENEREALPALLCEFEAAWQRDGRETKPNGTWTRRADFELSVEAQQRVLESHVEADVWQRMTTAFASGIKSRISNRTKKPSPSKK